MPVIGSIVGLVSDGKFSSIGVNPMGLGECDGVKDGEGNPCERVW